MIHTTNNGDEIEYYLLTDPVEAMYWSTYRLKKSHICLTKKYDRATTSKLKQEIFDGIIESEKPPSKENKDNIFKRC